MALNIKNSEVEHLASEVAKLTGETKTEAIRRALVERRGRLAYLVHDDDLERRMRRSLEEIWAQVPPEELGRTLTRAEEDEILGYGPEGV